MKTAKFSSRISKQIKSKNKEAQNLEKGGTKALTDKCKLEILYNIKNLNVKKIQKGLT